MDRTQLLERIAELDKKINAKVDANRKPRLNLKHRSFPTATWVSAIVFAGLWIFGDSLPYLQDFMDDYTWLKTLFLVLAALGLLSAVYHTFMYMVKGRAKVDKNYQKKTEEIMVIQKERENLQKQLEALDKK